MAAQVISKRELKNIIKECLIELLQECALSPRDTQMVPESRIRKPQCSERQATRTPSRALREAIEKESGGDPIMRQIFADTAASTLQTMMKHDVGNDTGSALVEQVEGAPEDIFGDAANNWADLAFKAPVRNRGDSPASHQQNSSEK